MKKNLSLVALFFIAGIIFAAFISYSAVREAYRNRKIEKEVAELKQEAERINNENSALSERIAYLETPQFQEKIAKEKLNLQKTDENVVVVKPSVSQQPQVSDTGKREIIVDEIRPNYAKWWDFFFKYN